MSSLTDADESQILFTTNFTTLTPITGDSRTTVQFVNGEWQFNYFEISTVDDMTALGYNTPANNLSVNPPALDQYYQYSPINPLSGEKDPSLNFVEIAAISNIFATVNNTSFRVNFSDVAQIQFTHGTTDNSQIVFGQTTQAYPIQNQPLGPETSALTDTTTATPLLFGDVWLNSDFNQFPGTLTTSWTGTEQGQTAYANILHEIGHALGLSHPFTVNADGTITEHFAADGTNLDSQQYTIMSYNLLPGMDAPGPGNEVYPDGLQLLDIAAIQSIYGRNYAMRGTDDPTTADVNEANTTYSKANAFSSNAQNGAFIYTIWDGAGVDAIDASGFGIHAFIDLRQGAFSSIGYSSDSIFDASNPEYRGKLNPAFDLFDLPGFYQEGQAKDNVAIAFHTVIENAIGTGGDDILVGNEWNNVMYGGAGKDQIYGSGLQFDGQQGYLALDPFDLNDPNFHVPIVQADVLIGGKGDDIIYGGAGNDILHGGLWKADLDSASPNWNSAGQFNNALQNDQVDWRTAGDKADGIDTADYSKLGPGITLTINMHAGEGTIEKSGGLGTDHLYSIDKVIGTDGNDVLHAGNPSGMIFDGGDGYDTVTYSYVTYNQNDSRIYDLATASTYDTLLNFENVDVNAGRIIVNTHIAQSFEFGVPNHSEVLDYRTADVGAIFTFNEYFDIDTHSNYPYFYTGSIGLTSDINIGGVHQTGHGFAFNNYMSFGTTPQDLFDLVFGLMAYAPASEIYRGTDMGDLINITLDPHIRPGIIFETGLGNDTVNLTGESNYGQDFFGLDTQGSNITYTGGNDTINGAGLLTTLSFAADIRPDDVTFNGSVVTVAGHGVITLNGLSSAHPLQYVFLGTNDSATIDGSVADDHLNSNNDRDETINALPGNDTVTINGGGQHTVYGGLDNDTLISSSGANTLYGGADNDTYIVSQNALTTIVDTEGANTIQLSDISRDAVTVTVVDGDLVMQANDPTTQSYYINGSFYYLHPSDGNILTITAGAAISDVSFADGTHESLQQLYADAQAYTNPIVDLNPTTDGNDTISFNPSGGHYAIDLKGGDDEFLGGVGNADMTVYGGAGREFIVTWAGNDHIYGDAGDDYNLDGGAGNDVINGGDGSDKVVFGSYLTLTTGVMVNLETGIVSNDGTGGQDTLISIENVGGSNLDDTITGSDEVNFLDGNNGNDTISGLGGDDYIDGGRGNNTIDGGDGTDTYFVTSVTGTGLTINLMTGTATNIYGGHDTLTSIENIEGGFDGHNDITGSDVANNINIAGGNSIVRGMGGDDIVVVQSQTGQTGNIVDGGAGNDSLTGGRGDETYLFRVGDGQDTVTDTVGNNTLQFQGIADQYSFTYAQSGNDLVIGYGVNDSVAVKGYFSNPVTVSQILLDGGQTYALSPLVTAYMADHAPIAQDDSFISIRNLVLTGNVIANNGNGVDSDPDGDALHVLAQTVTTAAGGTAVFLSSGDFTYTPSSGFMGIDTFNYTLKDFYGKPDIGQVTVEVVPPLPVARPDDFSVSYNQTLSGNVLADNGHGADFDPEGGTLQVTAGTFATAHGSVTIAADGGFTYMAHSDYVGGDSFSYTLTNNFGGVSTGIASFSVGAPAGAIVGTNNNDTLFGTAGDDTFYGLRGSDSLIGGNGNDTYVVAAGWGSDTINESSTGGFDTIRITELSSSQVRLFTDSQGSLHIVSTLDPNDSITVFAGVTGQNTAESKIGQYMEQIVFDDRTVDLTGGLTITGSTTGETLYGTSFNDTINGDAGNDSIFGNAGNDTIIGGFGSDSLIGGSGDDTYIFAAGWGADTINEVKATGGFDTIRITGLTADDIRLFTDSQGNLHVVNKLDPNDTITVFAGVTGQNTAESTIGQYMEQIVFDDGTTINLTGSLTIEGSSTGETLYGTAFADTIYGYDGNDSIFANGSGDTVNGGGGSDSLIGGAGDDTYIFSPSWGADTVNESLNGGNDTIRITDLTVDQVRLFTDSQGNLHIINKLDANDTITVFAGVTGQNTAESTIGLYMEKIVLDDGTTISLTGALNIEGSATGETLYGTSFGDTISGLAGNDAIFGNAGNDTIIGGAGSDSLIGGSGDDIYIFNVGWGADTVNEVKTTGGSDTIQINGLTPDEVRLFTDSQGNLHIVNKLDANDNITVFGGVTGQNTAESTIGQYVEHIAFDNGALIDLTGALTIEGSPSGETLYGTAFSDTIYGYGGNDSIFGNAGNDTIIGGVGSDSLNGGGGDDTYVFAPGWGADSINDGLNNGNDTIRITGLTPADIRLFTDSQGNLHVISNLDPNDNITVFAGVTGQNTAESKIGLYMEQIVFDDGTTINLTGGLTIEGSSSGETLYGTAYADSILGDAGGDVIFGNAGNDILIGGTGADNLQGGTGNDKFIFSHGDGADFVNDQSGNNILSFEGGLTQADVAYARVSNNLVITYGSNGSDNVTISNFYNEDPNLVTFVFQFSDGSTFNPQSFLPDHNPIALPDDFTGTMNHIVAGNVLADNGHGADYDIDQDTLSVVPDFLNTAHGQAILNADGSFTYQSSANFIGTDSFTYTLLDGRNGSATATVTLNITHGTNTAPVAQPDDFSAYKNQPISGNVLANNGHGADYDPDGDGLTVTAGIFATAHGSVTINANGTLTYTPVTGYAGGDTFQYTLNDGFGGQTAGTVNLTLIDRAPGALNDNLAVDQGQVLYGNVLANNGAGADYDPDGDALTVTAGSFTTAQGGAVVLNADGTFTYMPLGAFSGFDSFNYTVSDGTLQASATVGITVTQVTTNHNPIAEPDSFALVQDGSLTGNVLANNGNGVDFDPDNDPLSVTAGTFVTAHGSVTLNADGSFSYAPAAGYFGLDSFNYTLLDGQGGQATGTATFSIDGLPVAKADTFHGQENQAVTGNLLVDNGHGMDSDPDNDALSVTPGTFATAHGSVTINTDGTFSYTPVANYFGADSFTYTISDGRGGTATATASLALNGTPVAHADNFSAIVGQGVTGNVLANNGGGADSDPDGGILSVAAGTYATVHGGTVVIVANGSFSYTPSGFMGQDFFSYTLLDGQGGETTGGVTITNDFPTATITGTNRADHINGTNGDDVIFGLRGGDTISGIGGNDILHGGDGKDVLTGGNGNDLLYGAGDSDTLTGSGGADTFMFVGGDGNKDIITDFNAAEGDRIDFSLFIQNPNPDQSAIDTFIHAKVQGGNTILSVDLNGAAGGSHFTNAAVLQGVTNFDIATAVANGTLIA